MLPRKACKNMCEDVQWFYNAHVCSVDDGILFFSDLILRRSSLPLIHGMSRSGKSFYGNFTFPSSGISLYKDSFCSNGFSCIFFCMF